MTKNLIVLSMLLSLPCYAKDFVLVGPRGELVFYALKVLQANGVILESPATTVSSAADMRIERLEIPGRIKCELRTGQRDDLTLYRCLVKSDESIITGGRK